MYWFFCLCLAFHKGRELVNRQALLIVFTENWELHSCPRQGDGSERPKAVTIHVTGFKKFQGVSENPTETIVNNLMSFVQRKRLLPAGVTLGSCTVLETAGNGALPVLYKVLESGVSIIDVKNEQVIWVNFYCSALYMSLKSLMSL